MNDELQKALHQRTLLFDGAMGTMLAMSGVKSACNELLCLTQPDVIAGIHRSYLAAGSDIVTTNTFGASRVMLAEHGLVEQVRELNIAAARIARQEVKRVQDRRCFVAGELGPTSKLPTLGHITFAELFEAYCEQAQALIEGGIDCFIVATSQDPLQVKAALAAIHAAQAKAGQRFPLIASVTMERAGTMLLGTELPAALASLMPYGLLAFGINCATGPADMEEAIRTLSDLSPLPIICQPNAGMPEIVAGESRYTLSPEIFAETLADFVARFGVAIVGGCCGTQPEHIAALRRAVEGRTKTPSGRGMWQGAASSLYAAVALDQKPPPFIIAEQTNVNGSKKFREMLARDDFDAMAQVGKDASRMSHALDICVAMAARDERADMQALVSRVALGSQVPVMIDSTRPEVVEAALSHLAGRSIINSINLEDGGSKALRVLLLAKRYGALVVALTIDEHGMARDVATKLSIARRLVALAASKGLSPSDLLIDPLTFTLASGDPELVSAGRETLMALEAIKRELPGVRTVLGISNVSFGLPPAARPYLTSVFLHQALKAGLDAAIINPARILPIDRIPPKIQEICERLVQGADDGGDPLAELIAAFAQDLDLPTGRGARGGGDRASLTPEEALREKVMEGSREGLEPLIQKLLEHTEPSAIIKGILLPAMQEVGSRFGQGRLPLPFVLQAAEALRAGLDCITPHLPTGADLSRGTLVLATVRGDVHDIGKNLVDAILSNSGFRVINLGIKQTAAAVIAAVREHRADAIGLSGLLVPSTEVMREDLELFREAGIRIPVLCGGAALRRSFVETVLAEAYGGEVRYCPDAFSGLQEMERVMKQR